MVKHAEMLNEKNKVLRVIYGFKFSFHNRLQNEKQRFKCTNNLCQWRQEQLDDDDNGPILRTNLFENFAVVIYQNYSNFFWIKIYD